MEKKYILQVGDFIYECGNYGINKRIQIERVTPKIAYYGILEFKREVIAESGRIEKGKGHYGDYGLVSYYIETEKRKQDFEHAQKLKFVADYKSFHRLTPEQIEAIYNIITPT